MTFENRLLALENQLGGRSIHHMPVDAGGQWRDATFQLQPVPAPSPGTLQAGLLFEVQANCSRLYTTSHRGCAERGFGCDWQWKMLGSRTAIQQQYLQRLV